MAYDVRSLTTTAGTGLTFTLDSPVGTKATDALFVLVVHGAGVSIPGVPPGGWSLAVTSAFNTFSTVRVIQTSSRATSGPWTFTFSAPTAYVAAAVAIAVDTAVIGAQRPVVDTAATKVTPPTTDAFAFPPIVPTNTGDLILWLAGWSRYTTMTAPSGITPRVQLSSGTSSTDMTLWVGSQPAATTAGVPTGSVSVVNDNPSAFAADGQSMITVAFKSAPPPTTWVGDFETGDFSQYAFVLEASPDRIEIRSGSLGVDTFQANTPILSDDTGEFVDSTSTGTGTLIDTLQNDTPVLADDGNMLAGLTSIGLTDKYARFTAWDDDVYPLTPTENPRASLVSPRLLFAGIERWISFSVRFPDVFPIVPPTGWLVFFQYHGPPYTGSPSIGFGVDGDNINIERNQTYNYDTAWITPMVREVWIDFVIRINFSYDETGFMELWMNGEQQMLKGGVRRLYMRTVELDQESGLEIDPLIYRKRGMFPVTSLDMDNVRFDATPPPSLVSSLLTAPPLRTLDNLMSTSMIKTRVVN